MARAFVGVLDSFGVGAADDADAFGDAGANTFAHIAMACATGKADGHSRAGPLSIPNLTNLGLAHAAEAAGSIEIPVSRPVTPTGCYGYAAELSWGKDTPSGHWEMMGTPVEFEWGYFPEGPPSFPRDLIVAIVKKCALPGILGDKHASGTAIIDELGEAHLETGKPIFYTSADSVLQIAAHEDVFGLDRLYDVCATAREMVDGLNVGRVIARPFTGARAGEFVRTGNRKDYTTPPHRPTLLDAAKEIGREVIAIGKVSDIFAGSGVTRVVKATGNDAIFDAWLEEVDSAPDGAIVFANFVDFDTLYGHRRDVVGYAKALEDFDRRLPEMTRALQGDDIVVLSADHGCDPTWPGTDHTREFVPVLAFGPNTPAKSIGKRKTFADIGQSLAHFLDVPFQSPGQSFL